MYQNLLPLWRTNEELMITAWEGLGFTNNYNLRRNTYVKGSRHYELSNHTSTLLSAGLGNVLAVVSDRKIEVDERYAFAQGGGYKYENGAYHLNASGSFAQLSAADGIISSYVAEVISATDYYAFGAPMPSRSWQGGEYRFDFYGKEDDSGTQTQDYGFRIYNSRLGRFLSVDPLTNTYPWLTPYQYASNRPIVAIDLDGLESQDANGANVASDPNEIQFAEVQIIAERSFWQKYGGITKIGISTALDFIPGVGTGKGIIEAFTGKELVTGEKLAPWERALGIIPIIGKIGRGAKAIGKIADGVDAVHDMQKLQKGEVAAEALTDAARFADYKSRGKAAERFLAETYGVAGQGFEVTVGGQKQWRYVDNLVDGIAMESKVG